MEKENVKMAQSLATVHTHTHTHTHTHVVFKENNDTIFLSLYYCQKDKLC